MYEHNHVDQSGQKFRDKYRVFQRSQFQSSLVCQEPSRKIFQQEAAAFFNNNELLKNKKEDKHFNR